MLKSSRGDKEESLSAVDFFFSAENLVFTKLSSTFNIFTQVHFNVLSQI